MKNTTLLAASLAVGATGAFAGGMDRSGQSIAPIFEDGSYVELSFGSITPSVSGTLGVSSGSMAPSYTRVAGAYKRDLSDSLSMALIIDQPFGADVDYPTGTGYALAGSKATVTTTGITALLRYKFSDRISVLGGIKHLTSHGEVELPFAGYSLDTTTENDWGYILGAAYEIPDIALRASLTYSSATDIAFTASEDLTGVGAADSALDVTMPQTVNFDFQTGIAADTLLMFSARWAEWSSTTITPDLYTTYVATGDNLVDHADDTVSYSLGIGRRFNDKLSGSVSVGYEESKGGVSGNLSPTDGYTSITAGVKYKINEQTAISGGVSYVWIGDTTTDISGNATDFSDNSAFGFGLKLSHTF
ncbi:OmpP1/FadL family transporter [Pacificibacter marinus]|uniref:Outer membrane protein transport protein (OMPP1/FadL/TodX) n=1 Tax=Pacificibacter marinus TaxID=658057 RepID=A0A1Y5STQ2_9RHOB|nr:outer membrane protein transport protein [Pacificibacter marinus]SEK83293.1 Long-chain fatty acid transport protein [Pacificibacter marinus]SLN48312.1 Outer membrane protein transport protein (OMPP1/FadL/TodX) [Pacificibacter marinus]